MFRRFDPEAEPCRGKWGLGALVLFLGVGCARESAPIVMVPAPPMQAALPGMWQLPPELARIPPPVAPYVRPDPLQPLPNLTIPQWAGVAAAPFAAAVQRAAIFYQLPAELIWAVIKVESNFRETAVSRAG